MAKEGVTKFNWSTDKNIPRLEDILLATLVEEPTKCRAELKEAKQMGEDENGVGFGNIAIEIPPEFRNGRRGGLEFLVTESQSSGLEVLSPDNWVHVTKCFPERNSVLVAGKPGSGKTGNGPSSETMSLEPALANGAGVVIHVHSPIMWTAIMESGEISYQERFVAVVGYQMIGGWTERVAPPRILNKPFSRVVDFSDRGIYAMLRVSGRISPGLTRNVLDKVTKMPYKIPVTSVQAEYGTPELAMAVRKGISAAILRRSNRGFLQRSSEYLGNKLLGRNEPDYITSGIIAMGGHKDGIIAYAPTAKEATQMIFDCLMKAERIQSIRSGVRPTQPAF